MFLTSFELKGFKSFKEKTVLEFKDGLTTIVGPNGSGKSNIADGFRWVLGEQRVKSLRGDKSEDIIFGGTETLSEENVAYIKMTMDNRNRHLKLESDEVSIMRKIYRKGENQYFINGESVRLKDIHNLFADTGLGRDSFSIIGQGEIDNILNAKEVDRRKFIEELSGIVKYRIRKEESIKKIDHAKDDLIRIMDILGELEIQDQKLSKESKKAKSYVELNDKFQKMEINILSQELKINSSRLDEVEKKKKEVFDLNSDNLNKLNKFQLLEEKNRLEALSIEDNLRVKRDLLLEKKDESGDIREELVKKESIIHNFSKENQNLMDQIKKLEDKKEMYKSKYGTKIAEKEIVEEELKFLKKEFKELENHLNSIKDSLKKNEEEILFKERSTIDLYQEIAVINNEIKGVKEDILRTENQKDVSLKKNKLKDGEIKELNEKLQGFQEKLSLSYIDKDKYMKEVEAINSANESLINEVNTHKDKLNEIFILINNKKSKLLALKDVQNEYSTYFGGVKSILTRRDQGGLSGIIGVVGELLDVPFELFTAINSAVGGSLQDIIVKNSEDGKACINYLKETKSGRATFLPLDLIKEKNIHEEARKYLNYAGVLGIGSSLIDIKGLNMDESTLVLKYLLGNILIVDNIDTGRKISKESKSRIKIVTLEGDIFAVGGSMSGGNVKNTNSILSRQKTMEKLEEDLLDLNKVRGEYQNKIDDLNKEVYPLEGKKTALLKKCEDIIRMIHQMESDCKVVSEKIKYLKNSMDEEEYGEKEIKEEIEGLLKEINILEESKKNKEEYINKVLKEIEIMKNNLSESRDDLSDQFTKLKNFEILEGEKKEKLRNFDLNLKGFYDEVADIDYDIEKLKKSDSFDENTIGILKEEVKILKAKLDDVKNLVEDTQRIIKDNENKKSDLENENINILREIAELNKYTREVTEEISKYDVEIALVEENIKVNSNILNEKYGLLPGTSIQNMENAEITYDKNDLKSLDFEIRKLGNINLDSILEYEEVHERLSLLLNQKADLDESILGLNGVIEEINEIMKVKFFETFNALNEAFSDTYRDLFTGGHAYLKLCDENDILETGVEVYSKPPGKNPKSLQTLSGGERALTALALLFAILKIKPSPLCLVDEADASLDEVNVSNFAGFLKKFSKKTQFIVISHRQGTIMESNSLYGVTMDKRGVSKIVSLELNKGVEYGEKLAQ